MKTFAPTVLINGITYTPTNRMWLLAFAIAGCDWAIDALEQLDIQNSLGSGI